MAKGKVSHVLRINAVRKQVKLKFHVKEFCECGDEQKLSAVETGADHHMKVSR